MMKKKTIGYKSYDEALTTVMQRVVINSSREELLKYFMDTLSEISDADAIFVLEGTQETRQNQNQEKRNLKSVSGWGYKKINGQRWKNFQNNILANYSQYLMTRKLANWFLNHGKIHIEKRIIKSERDSITTNTFSKIDDFISHLRKKLKIDFSYSEIQTIEKHASVFTKESFFAKVLTDKMKIDCWNVEYFPDLSEEISPLIDSNNVWVSGIHLPPATARFSSRALFLLYKTNRRDSPPRKSDQDLRAIEFFKGFYSVASYRIHHGAKDIFLNRQELLKNITPSILSHELFGYLETAKVSCSSINNEIKKLKSNLESRNEEISKDVDKIIKRIEREIQSPLINMFDVSDAVLRLQKESKKGEEIEIYKLLEKCKIFLRQRFSKIGAKLKIENKCVDLQKIKSDSGLLSHAILNILTNALDELINKDKPPRSVKIEIQWEEQSVLPLNIYISNNGRPIPEQLLNHIFEFGISFKIDGHGLGLFIVKSILEYLGGEVSARNQNAGACFRIRLPRKISKLGSVYEEAKYGNKSS